MAEFNHAGESETERVMERTASLHARAFSSGRASGAGMTFLVILLLALAGLIGFAVGHQPDCSKTADTDSARTQPGGAGSRTGYPTGPGEPRK